MSNLPTIYRKRVIHSITTDTQPSTPLPADRIIIPDVGPSYIQRHRFVYRWKNSWSNKVRSRAYTLYQGTRSPLLSEIRLFRNKDRKLIVIFPGGDKVEPPTLLDSQVPFATVVVIRDYLPCPPSLQPRQTQPLRIGAPMAEQPIIPSRQPEQHDNNHHQNAPAVAGEWVLPERTSGRKRRAEDEGPNASHKRIRRTAVPFLSGFAAGLSVWRSR